MRDSPSVIAEKRAARQAKKEEVKRRKESGDVANKGSEPEDGFDTSHIKRSFVPIPADLPSQCKEIPGDARCTVRLLTYNILAQSLVRRKLFPNSGEAVKWKNRQKVLMSELSHYDCDVMCLQEVGHDMLDSCLKDFLAETGYLYDFHAGERKKHGLLIAYKKSRFCNIEKKPIDYDDAQGIPLVGQAVAALPGTRNVGLICILEDIVMRTRLVVSTTHLFWHPKGTLERARQLEILIRETMKLGRDADIHENIIIAGDFNTEPVCGLLTFDVLRARLILQMDPTYLSITQRPFILEANGRRILEESSAFLVNDDICTDEDSGDVLMEQQFKTSTRSKVDAIPVQPVDTCEAETRIERLLETAHLRSLYSRHYSLIAPGNIGHRGEPACTNYAHAYKGTLDYIFVPYQSQVICTGLLDVPDINELRQSQPSEGEFPSDHFALGTILTI